MEQRNGRIDRKLQPNPEVYCHYFVYTAAPEDRILAGAGHGRPRRSSGSWAASPRCSKAGWPGRSSRASATATSPRWSSEIDAADLDADIARTVEEELEAARERQDRPARADRAPPTLLEASQEWHRLSTRTTSARPSPVPWS